MTLETFSPIIQMALMTLLTLAIPALFVYIRQWLLTKTDAGTIANTVNLVRAVVLAVEQEAKNHGWSAEHKKAEALQRAEAILKSYGIVLDLDQLSDLIESLVYDELNRWNEVPTLTPLPE